MAGNLLPQSKLGWRPLAGLMALCFLLALGAMRSDLFPDSVSSSTPQWGREALPFGLLAAVAGFYAAVSKGRWPRGRQFMSIVLISLALFVVPSLIGTFAQSWVSAFSRVALFSLAPVFAVVFEPYIGKGSDSRIGLPLLATLASVVGMLCVFPVDIPSSIEAGAAFIGVIAAAAVVAAATCSAVRVANELSPSGFAPMTAIAGAATALCLMLTGILTQGFTPALGVSVNSFVWSTLVTLPGLVLLFWLMPRISATRITTRFLLAPLIAILIGMAIDRPSVGPRIWFGLVLIAGGVSWLLFAPSDSSDQAAATLGLN